jgi:ABC-2 type transport system ATP-binding protein
MRETILRLQRELGLTILLSSHFLSEVEQICTRIAVMNKGRKVFEGSLAETKRREQWVRLRVGDFSLATTQLRDARLISDHRDGALVALADGAGTDQIVRLLVERGMPVYEVAHAEETLEDFYLRLMKSDDVLLPT